MELKVRVEQRVFRVHQALACAFADSNLKVDELYTLVPELSLSIAPRLELITPALATVAKLRATGNDVVNASRKRCFRRNEETELANFFDRSHAAE